ncbi:hypothetical protein E2C01_097236 [Portunus trituberculatus]|uniref:Uncharacterized protein n=1 Tax=Portunus trituberculatus TaxID=210409 RepID=A0A5B7K446_PORTR|nr:hypothetical protein [Portunus trituberculatus]
MTLNEAHPHPFTLPMSVSLQLSTGTGVISQFVNLYVVVPQAYILGSKDLHVQLGSTIKLTCVIKQVRTRQFTSSAPGHVFIFILLTFG